MARYLEGAGLCVLGIAGVIIVASILVWPFLSPRDRRLPKLRARRTPSDQWSQAYITLHEGIVYGDRRER